MRKFFKKEEKLPFQFSAIEERRSGTNYFAWVISVILIISISIIFFLIFR